jgi:hypothetical protein
MIAILNPYRSDSGSVGILLSILVREFVMAGPAYVQGHDLPEFALCQNWAGCLKNVETYVRTYVRARGVGPCESLLRFHFFRPPHLNEQ